MHITSFTYFNIALIIVVAVLTALSYYKGKRTLFALIVSFYPAAGLYAAFPYKAQFLFFNATQDQVFYSHVLMFAVFFVLSYLAFGRIVHSDGSHSGVSGFIEALSLSISIVLLTVALSFHILPYSDIYGLSESIQSFFSADLGYFVSMIAPMVAVYWMGRRY